MARNILSWKGTDIAVQRAIRRYPRERLIPVVESVLRRESLRMETHAKQNAPWTDRTGAARRGLTGSVETQGYCHQCPGGLQPPDTLWCLP